MIVALSSCAHGNDCDESSTGPAISSHRQGRQSQQSVVFDRASNISRLQSQHSVIGPGGQLDTSQPPNTHDRSQPEVSKFSMPKFSIPEFSSPSASKLALSLVMLEKAHRRECHSHGAGVIPRDSLVRHGRFREISCPNELSPLLETGKFEWKIIEGSREGNPDIAPFHPVPFQPDVYISLCGT